MLIPGGPSHNIQVKSQKTLETIQEIKHYRNKKYAVIDGQLAALFPCQKERNKPQWFIAFYDANNNFQEIQSIPISSSIPRNMYVESMQQLANGLIVCRFKSTILLLQKTNGAEVQYIEINSTAVDHDDKVIELVSGELLIHTPCKTSPFKIWNINHPKPINFNIECTGRILDIFPMIDGVHLALTVKDNCEHSVLYNMKTKEIKNIAVDDYHTSIFHLFPNGSLSLKANDGTQKYSLAADLEEMRHFKRTSFNTFFQKCLLAEQLSPLPEPLIKELKDLIVYQLFRLELNDPFGIVRFIDQYQELMAEEEEQQQENVFSM